MGVYIPDVSGCALVPHVLDATQLELPTCGYDILKRERAKLHKFPYSVIINKASTLVARSSFRARCSGNIDTRMLKTEDCLYQILSLT
jgi:hypothetical protein